MNGRKARSAPTKPVGTATQRSLVRSLPVDEWPVADRLAWKIACSPGQRLQRGGVASHLKPISQNDLARRYGYFLDYLIRSGEAVDLAVDAAFYITPERVDGYIAQLNQRVSSVTVYGSIHKLRRMAQFLAPQRDFAWLIELENDLDIIKQPKSQFGRFVYTERLVEVGIQMMRTASVAENVTALRRARQFRDGLMIALLAICPIRLKNFAALEIGNNFKQTDGTWWIVLPAGQTKEGRADERPAPDYLTKWINFYLDIYRPILARNREQRALWLGLNDGGPLTYSAVEKIITETTRDTLGIAIGPHMFRTAAASSAATYCGKNRNIGTALLHHSDIVTTQMHYNRASGIAAASEYATILNHIRKDV